MKRRRRTHFRFLLFAIVVLFVASATGQAASSVHLDAHAFTCQSFQISWNGGTPPFHFSLQDTTTKPSIILVSQTQSDNSFVWTPNVPAGTLVKLQLNDSTGSLTDTTTFAVQAGTDTSCVINSNSTFSSLPTATVTATVTATPTNRSILPGTVAGSSQVPLNLSSATATPMNRGTAVASSSHDPSSAATSSGNTSNALGGAAATNSDDMKNDNNTPEVAAIVVPICIAIFGVLGGVVFCMQRRRRQRPRLSIDPEGQLGSVSTSTVEPYVSPTTMTPAPILRRLEKTLPAEPPDRVSEPQMVSEGIEEMAAGSGAESETARVAELQRQIQDLMAENSILSGERPPEYT